MILMGRCIGRRILAHMQILNSIHMGMVENMPMIMNGKLDITYSLRFPVDYDNVMRKRIENHFTRLDLLKRYRENTDDKISELSSEIKSGVCYGVTDDKITSIVKRKAHDMQEKFGINYWVAILNIACVEDATIYNYIKDNE